MTPDIVHALEISGSIMLAVVLFIVVISFVAVRRGEAEMTSLAENRKQGRSGH